jgi:hypothetical protein
MQSPHVFVKTLNEFEAQLVIEERAEAAAPVPLAIRINPANSFDSFISVRSTADHVVDNELDDIPDDLSDIDKTNLCLPISLSLVSLPNDCNFTYGTGRHVEDNELSDISDDLRDGDEIDLLSSSSVNLVNPIDNGDSTYGIQRHIEDDELSEVPDDLSDTGEAVLLGRKLNLISSFSLDWIQQLTTIRTSTQNLRIT